MDDRCAVDAVLFVFFFSSRRRHTRWNCDWSSDVCSSDLERVRRLGIEPVVFPATGTSEDVAMLLADDKGATIIVAVGTHATLVEFLDKGRSGMASTFLTRLRVGGKLVDAKGVSRLYRSRISNLSLTVMLLVGLSALFAALWSTTGGRAFLQVLGARWDDLWSSVVGIFT